MRGIAVHNRVPSTWAESDFKAAASHLGFDPNRIIVENTISSEMREKIQKELNITIEPYAHIPAFCDPHALTVTIFKDDMAGGHETEYLKHEIYHVLFFACIDAVRENHDPKFNPFLYLDQESCDYVSEYVQEYKEQLAKSKIPFTLFATEVISEMARVYEKTGILCNTKLWRQFYLFIEQYSRETGMLK